jgi:competence protein ComEC
MTTAWSPLYLWSDISWYLSFLAFFGVLVIAPLINRRLYGDTEPRAILTLLTETICALAATLPFMLYIFHQLSIIALVANMLIVPLVPLAMLVALIAGMAGMLLPFMAGWIALPARLLLTYMLDVVQLLARIPHILVQRQLSVSGMITLYICLLVVSMVLWSKQHRNATITEINRSQD